MKAPKIYTSRDAAKAHEQAEAQRQHRHAVKEARAKVRKWERKVARYGGYVHRLTLLRMQQALAKLLEG